MLLDLTPVWDVLRQEIKELEEEPEMRNEVCIIRDNYDDYIEIVARSTTGALKWLIEALRISTDSYYSVEFEGCRPVTEEDIEKWKRITDKQEADTLLKNLGYSVIWEEIVE